MSLHGLAEMWEGHRVLRERAFVTKALMGWPSDKVIGIPSWKASEVNFVILKSLLSIYSLTKPPALQDIESQVGRFFEMCGIPKDPVQIHLDSWGLKRSVSYLVRRARRSKQSRASWFKLV